MIICGIVDTLTGKLVATSEQRMHRQGANILARDLNRLNAGPDYKYVGGFVNGHTYYRFSSFCFDKFNYYSVTHPFILSNMTKGVDFSEFESIAQLARTELTNQAELSHRKILQDERDKINSFDIPEEYKQTLIEDLERCEFRS